MAAPMTAAALRSLLADMPDDTPLHDDATGLPILDVHVGVDGALVVELDGPPPGRVVNSFIGDVDGPFIQAGTVRGATIRF